MSAYSVDQVADLMPAVWDSSVVLNRRNPLAPEPEMPKAQSDPRSTINKTIECADVQVAWALAPLTTGERRALLLRYGFDMGVEEAGAELGVSFQRASVLVDNGLTRMARYLGSNAEVDDYE